MLAKMNHRRWDEWCLTGVVGITQERLHSCVFSDLLNSDLIGQAKPLLDEERTKRQPHWFRRGAGRRVELRGICFFQLFPWHQGGEDDSTVFRVQRAAKRHMKLFD
jgi:hypothetical protein